MINILVGIDSSRTLAHVINFNICNGDVRSIVGSYKDSDTLDIFEELDAKALYSDYEIGKNENDDCRYFATVNTPEFSLIPHDTTLYTDEITWLSVLRMLINTKSKILINDIPIPLTSVSDSNSSLSLVLTGVIDNQFFSKRLSGIDFHGNDLDISNFIFLTPIDCPEPFSDFVKGETVEINEGDGIVVYNKTSIKPCPHYRQLPGIITDFYTLSKLVMLKDILSMVTYILSLTLFDQKSLDSQEPGVSTYVTKGYISLKGQKYRNLKQTALMFMDTLKSIAEDSSSIDSKYVKDETFDVFFNCYKVALQDPLKYYYQYKKFQSLLSVLLMECKLNLFHSPSRMNQKPRGKIDYNIHIGMGGSA